MFRPTREVFATGTIGDAIASTAGDASNTSDGMATIGTGNATARGNVSTTVVTQGVAAGVAGPGLIVAPEAALVVNVGVGLANTGVNSAVGNESTNTATLTQLSSINADNAGTIDGSSIASASGTASNESDGAACVCTGDANATGNIADTVMTQSLDLSVGAGGGLIVTPTVGVVLNLGLGVANSGLNEAIGNHSNNTATTTQSSIIALAQGEEVDGTQIANNGGNASSSSAGTGKVGTGKASAIGNESTTGLVQGGAVGVDGGAPVVALLTGLTTNAGAGLANSGLSRGIGNESVNRATLLQDATGRGVVSNSGSAENRSDGTGVVGNPTCPVPGTPTSMSTRPGSPSTLPRTGGPLEAEAAIAAMLLLSGFALRKQGKILELRNSFRR